MSSSDSEDDFICSVAENLKKAREQCRKKLESAEVDCEKYSGKSEGNCTAANPPIQTTSNTENVVKRATNASFQFSTDDDSILDEILANNPLPAARRRGPRKKKEPVVTNARGRGRGGKRGRPPKINVADTETSNNLSSADKLNGKRKRSNIANLAIEGMLTALRSASPGGKSRKRSRVKSPNNSVQEILQSLSPVIVNRRGRGRQRGRGRGARQPNVNIPSSNLTQCSPIYPTYSVGNTDEYPDKSDDMPLFSKPPTNTTDDVIIIDEKEPEDNEPLSVKVMWRSQDVYRFTIWKYERISQIFELFAEKENIGKDKLLFTYNNKILTCDDTPALIDYNIAKFIDGGVVSNSLTKQLNKKTVINGVNIKFQCQNMKKPLEITIGKDVKVSSAMNQCAERLEVPLNKLKFEFDGDMITGTNTPQQLGLENGDCIDVMILN